MAWIKWTIGFADKPEVLETARRLSLLPEQAAVLWMRFFEWVDRNTMNGHIPSVTAAAVDQIVHTAGFAEAGVAVGWMIFQETNLILPNFTRHNGKSAKTRALAVERQQAARARRRKPGEPPSR